MDKIKSFVQATCPMCSERDNDDMIQCCTCQSWLHFACTKLPAYRILTFSKTQRKFTCENCTEEPGDNLQLKCFNSQVCKPIVENFDEDIRLMQHEIKTLKVMKDKHTEHHKMEIQRLQKEIKELKEHFNKAMREKDQTIKISESNINDDKETIRQSTIEKKELEEKIELMNEKDEESKKIIITLKNENDKLKQQASNEEDNKELKKKLKEKEKEAEQNEQVKLSIENKLKESLNTSYKTDTRK